MRSIGILSGVLFLALTVWFKDPATGAALEKIRFPYSPMSWNSLPWWMAKDAGYFEKNGLKEGFMPPEAFTSLIEQLVSQNRLTKQQAKNFRSPRILTIAT